MLGEGCERPGLVLRSSRPLHSFCLLRCLNITECLQGLFILFYYYDYFLLSYGECVAVLFYLCVCM